VLTTLIALLAAAVTIPGQQPQLAHEGNRTFLVAAHEQRVVVRRSENGGRTFRNATPIAVDGRMAAGMHRGPRVAVTRTAVLVAVIAGAQGGGKDGDVVLYRSADDGASWSAPVVVNDVAGAAREGLHGMAASPEGLVVITWLDLREKGTHLYGAVSRDHGQTWSPDTLIYGSPGGSICECCHPSVAASTTSGVAVMFRNHVAGARDLYVTRSTDGILFTPAEKQGSGTWHLNACPMDGGGIVLSASGVSSVWRREDGIFLSTPGVPERRIGVGRDPVIAAGPSGLDLAWTTADGILLQRGTTTRLVGAGKAATLLAFPAHTLLAWEQQGQVVTTVVPR
jgi:uncharacterized protein YfiM (DUF2279 family)